MNISKRCSFKALLVVLFIMFSFNAKAKELEDPQVLAQYIAVHCKKRCVNPDTVFIAVQEAAIKYNIPVNMLLAIMRVESSFKPKAENLDSVGLMQVNLKFHAKKFKVSYYDIFANVDIGASIYRDCLNKRKNDTAKALRCYNGENAKNMIYPNKVIKAFNEINALSLSNS